MTDHNALFSIQFYNLDGKRLAATMPSADREAAEYITDQINRTPRLALKAAVQVVGSSTVEINGAGMMINNSQG